MWTDAGTALDVLKAARLIRDFSAGLTSAEFKADITIQSPVLFQVIVLGESIKRFSKEFRDVHTSIPWDEIVKMCERCARPPDNINLDLVWNLASRNVGDIITYLEAIVPEPPGG
jgi:uncharacterized protein with HEPN domain